MLKNFYKSRLVLSILLFIWSISLYLNMNQLVSNVLYVKASKYSDNRIFDDGSYHQSSKPSNDGSSDQQLMTVNHEKKRIVILLASLPRSGSTLMAELLKSRSNTVLFFEPDHKTELSACYAIPKCMSDYLKSILTCAFDNEFEQWQRKMFFPYFHEKVKACTTKSCRMNINLREICHEADFTITKIIRVRLGFLHELLSNNSIDAKIIHLIRDPRASLLSNQRFGWVSDPALKCTNVYQDILAYEYLHKLYPHKIIQIKYEEFCVDPMGTAKTMFQFAYEDSSLSEKTIAFLEKHTTKSEVGAMNTVRNSSSYFQEWRWKIKEKTFLAIENETMCLKCIEKLNYRVFKNFKNLKDSTISLFSDKS